MRMNIPYDGIVTFLVFLIGIPALLLQTMTPEVRRAVMKQSATRVLVQAGTPLVMATFIVMYAFWMDSQLESGIPSLSTTPADAMSLIASLLILPLSRDQLWTDLIFILLAITAGSAILTVHKYGQRDQVILDLSRQVKPSRTKARLNEQALMTLIELGEQSAPGGDKELVLEALNQVVHQVSSHPQYQGDSLETLTTKLVDILTADDRPGTARNFYTAAGILQSIVISASAKERTVDLMYAIRALGYLSRAALSHVASGMEIENMLMNCVGSLALAASLRPDMTTQASEELFKLGIVLLEKKQEFIAVHTLDTLLTLVWATAPAQGELVTDTLGLVSHFWTDGLTARQYATEKLGQLRGALAQDLCAALEDACKHCIKTTYFQTADNVQQMINDLCGSQK
jgi:hypothetical protein